MDQVVCGNGQGEGLSHAVDPAMPGLGEARDGLDAGEDLLDATAGLWPAHHRRCRQRLRHGRLRHGVARPGCNTAYRAEHLRPPLGHRRKDQPP